VTAFDLIADRETGHPRGFVFVEMEESAAADAAIESVGIYGSVKRKNAVAAAGRVR